MPTGTVLPDGFSRTTGDLIISAEGRAGTGPSVQGLTTNGHVDISVAAGQPDAAVTIDGDLNVSAQGVLPANTPALP